MTARSAPRQAGNATPEVTLYEETYSHHCVKVRKLLNFKGVAYHRREVGYHDKRELLKASGQDYVPFLLWDGAKVPWHEIVAFVEGKIPAPTVFPGGVEGPARMVEQWAHDILEERVWRYVVPEVPPTFKDDLERWVFEEIQFWKRGSMESLKAKQPAAFADMKKHFALVERALAQHDYVLGAQPGLADFAIYGAIDPLYYVGQEIPQEFPKLRAWKLRVDKI